MEKKYKVFNIAVQSYSDVITNSSSEIFVVYNDKVVDSSIFYSIEEELCAYADEHDRDKGSGDGREITVDFDDDTFNISDEERKHRFTITIDHALTNTIEYIENKFNPIESFYC